MGVGLDTPPMEGDGATVSTLYAGARVPGVVESCDSFSNAAHVLDYVFVFAIDPLNTL